MKKINLLLGFVLFTTISLNAQSEVVHISVDAKNEVGDMNPIWAWFGHDEPNYTYMKDGKKLLSELAALSPTPVYMRCHNLLTSGDGTPALKWGSSNAYTEDVAGNPVYNWHITDSIFDTYVQRGMKPLAQIGFMPEALSTKPAPYKHDWQPGQSYDKIITGWAYPPKSYTKWGNLVYEWVRHCVQRYGKKEVESWYWEVWNEPNGAYWKGTLQEFFKLYDYAADGLKRALPTAKIGGADVTGGGEKFQKAFINHCFNDTNYVTGKIGSPLDLILFHAKGSPKVVNGYVRMDMSRQLRNINDGFKLIASLPETKNLPVVIGESDPEGCAACGMKTDPANAYRNGTMYSSYTAASFARKYLLADLYKTNLKGAVSWSFEFEDQPWFYGFRDLATNGVDKPVLNVFRMFGMMKGKRIETKSDHAYPLQLIRDSSVRNGADINAIASKDNHAISVMVWNYHDDDTAALSSKIILELNDIPINKVKVSQYVIDSKHSNSYEVWKKMNSPQNPTPAQVSVLQKSGMLEQLGKQKTVEVVNNKLQLNIELERQAVELIKLEW